MTLAFSKEARQQLDPVAKQFGLTCVASTERALRYENDKVFLNVNFDNGGSFELGAEIGRKDFRSSDPPFSLAEILRLRRVKDHVSRNALMVSDETSLEGALIHLA